MFVEWVGTEAFYGLALPRPFCSEPLCLHSCNYYLTLAALPAGYHFNPSKAHPGTGHSNFQRSVDFFPFLLTTDVAIGKGRQHHLVFHGGVVSLAALFVCCDPLRKRCLSRERDQNVTHPSTSQIQCCLTSVISRELVCQVDTPVPRAYNHVDTGYRRCPCSKTYGMKSGL